MISKQIIDELRRIQKDRPNVGANLTLFALINLLIFYFRAMGDDHCISKIKEGRR